jgi:hypothetical protein
LGAGRLAVERLALLPWQVGGGDDVEGHAATIPSRVVQARPEALPPHQRTVGQLVAEAIRFYGDHFWSVIVLGGALVLVDGVSFSRSLGVQTLLLWACAPVLTAAYVRASMLVAGRPVPRRVLVSAWLAGLIVFVPFPVLYRLYVLPGIALFGLVGLGVPAAVHEGLGVRDALRRAWRLGRADPVHAVGGIAALALIYGVTRYMLLILLATQGDQAQAVAALLADLVLSPILFVGAALLYVDQAARVE